MESIMIVRNVGLYFAIMCMATGVASPAYAEVMINQQALSQQQQDTARQNSLAVDSKPLLTASPAGKNAAVVIPEEKNCYLIEKINIVDKEALPHWLTFRDIIRLAQGQCIGINGIKALHKAIQDRIIDHGYITTRVIVPNQDLNQGQLTLRILPGTISGIVFKDGSGKYIHAENNLPDKKGSLLDLRGLEQGIENLQRIPGATAKINLLPGDKPGESWVEVNRIQLKSWRLSAWLDDSGNKYTGRNQGGLAFYLDNPSSLNDMFYVAYGGGLKNEDGKRSDNVSAWYSVPWGYWLADISASKYRYTQTIHSEGFSYLYRGIEKYISARLSRVMFRSASQKTTLSFKATKRDSSYFLNDVEIEVQKRDTSNWKLNLEHIAYLPFGELQGNLGYQHAARWFDEQPDAEEKVGSADRLARIVTLSLDGTFPFKLFGQSMSYEPHFMHQTSPDKLTQPDKFTIGNRWTVRGFDGEMSLYADKGWYIRNDINLNLPQWGVQPYLGVDYGEVSGSKYDYWRDKHLAGAVMGIRGVKGNFSYDLFAGAPIAKPEQLHTSPVSLGFAVQWQY